MLNSAELSLSYGLLAATRVVAAVIVALCVTGQQQTAEADSRC
jgi:hypothetical protein